MRRREASWEHEEEEEKAVLRRKKCKQIIEVKISIKLAAKTTGLVSKA